MEDLSREYDDAIVGYCEECGTGYERGLTYKMPGDGGIVWYICAHENCGVSMPCQ
tara:strand:- start:217 stop:381 length:165 start_codon:yes stop_codon:yes gene_type:complete